MSGLFFNTPPQDPDPNSDLNKVKIESFKDALKIPYRLTINGQEIICTAISVMRQNKLGEPILFQTFVSENKDKGNDVKLVVALEIVHYSELLRPNYSERFFPKFPDSDDHREYLESYKAFRSIIGRIDETQASDQVTKLIEDCRKLVREKKLLLIADDIFSTREHQLSARIKRAHISELESDQPIPENVWVAFVPALEGNPERRFVGESADPMMDIIEKYLEDTKLYEKVRFIHSRNLWNASLSA